MTDGAPIDGRATGNEATFAGNAVIMVATQLATMVVGLLASVLISRALGPAGRGAYYVPVTAVTVAFSLLHLSIELATRYFHAERLIDLRTLARVAATGTLVLGGFGLAVLAAPYLAGVREIDGVRTSNLALAALALPFIIHSTWLNNLFVLSGHLPRSQVISIIGAVFQTVSLMVLWFANAFTVERVLVVYVLASAVPWALLALSSRSFAPPIPTADPALVKRVVAHGLKIHVGFIAFYLLLRSDVFLVQSILTVEDVGLYSLAVLFAELIGVVAGAIAVAGLPFQSAEDAAAGQQATFQTVRTCLLVSAILALASAATMWWLLPTLYGPSFADAYGPMMALLPGVVAMSVTRPLWNGLLRDGRPGPITALLVSGFVLNVALNLLLLPRIGLYGASVSSTVAYLFLAVSMAFLTLRGTGSGPSALVPGPADARAGARALRALVARRGGGAPPASPAASA